MLITYKILALLLDYPDASLIEALPLMPNVLQQEGLLDASEQKQVDDFIHACSDLTLGDWQMLYVNQFDCGKRLNLYLLDHIYGDSRERGQAMVDLKEMYERAGLQMSDEELPDFIPLFLEYLSLQGDPNRAQLLLSDVRSVLEHIHKLLVERSSSYASLFAVLLKLAGEPQTTSPKDEPVNTVCYELLK